MEVDVSNLNKNRGIISLGEVDLYREKGNKVEGIGELSSVGGKWKRKERKRYGTDSGSRQEQKENTGNNKNKSVAR